MTDRSFVSRRTAALADAREASPGMAEQVERCMGTLRETFRGIPALCARPVRRTDPA